jgi:hypothetical protein
MSDSFVQVTGTILTTGFYIAYSFTGLLSLCALCFVISLRCCNDLTLVILSGSITVASALTLYSFYETSKGNLMPAVYGLDMLVG